MNTPESPLRPAGRLPVGLLALGLVLAVPALARAQTAAAPAPSDTPRVAAPGEPAVERSVVDGELSRIEELRIRGITQRVVVRSRQGGARDYEIVMPADGRNTDGAGRGASGQRVWPVWSF